MVQTELMLIESINKEIQLRRPDSDNVFPLSPTHRKELRQLKSDNVGNMVSRLRTLRDLKFSDFKKKYQKEYESKLQHDENSLQLLKDDWSELIKDINYLIKERIKFEDKMKVKELYSVSNGYSDLACLQLLKEDKEYRKITFDKVAKLDHILQKEFELKYENSFMEVEKIIDDLNTKYEEAINFGDLELVKKIYFILKDSENFFKKLSELKV